MSFNKTIFKVLGIEANESTRIFLLLGMGFFIGIFLATLGVGASTLFLTNFDEETDLPLAILLSGIFGIVATAIYNYFQSRVSFGALAASSLFLITVVIAGIETGFRTSDDPLPYYFFAFTFIVPSNFIVLLIFWGTFGRMFNLREAKRVIGSVDTGQLLASIIALFSIPLILSHSAVETSDLLFISLISVVGYLIIFFIILHKRLFIKGEKGQVLRINYSAILKNKYLGLMALFVIISMIAMNFVDYSFLSVITKQYDEKELPTFLSLFEATIVIFSFLFQTFVTDKIIATYGLKISLLITPLLIGIFTVLSIPIGYSLGYSGTSDTFIYFFIIISMSKLFMASLKDALDGPAFKLYFLPVDGSIRFDVQTKIEGVITAFAWFLAGGMIILINNIKIFTLIHVSVFTLPILGIWYLVTRKMHNNYKKTLQSTLVNNKKETDNSLQKEYSLNRVLENEVNSKADDKVIYGLKLMEKLEPALFESSIIRLSESDSAKIQSYATEKLKVLDIEFERNNEIKKLAKQAIQDSDDSEVISISSDNLTKLSKSVKISDRILGAKLLRKLIHDKNIFVLLELLRDIDPRVKMEAIITARKVKRPETWTILVELLDSPTYSSAASSALSEAGEPVLNHLETAFHKSGQTDQVMLKIVQIMGRIGGPYAIELLWKKIEYPDKRIVKQILLSFRYFEYQAQENEMTNLTNLLENEIGKMIWNLAALTEIPDDKHLHFLRSAIKEELATNTDTIYMILSIMYDPQSVQLVRENAETGTSDGIAFAIELLDLFLAQDLKPKLFPLFDDIPIHEKVRQLQVHFPRENYNLVQVLNYLLNKNYNQTNRWTKACCIHSLAFLPEFRISRGLIAQLFNQDRLLHEVAAWVMFHKDRSTFDSVAERLNPEIKKFLDESIENNKLQEGLKDGYFLGIEMVMFIKNLPIFNDIKGVLLCDLVDKMTNVRLRSGQKANMHISEQEERIIIVASGEVLLMNGEEEVMRLKTGDVFGNVFNLNEQQEATHQMAFGDAVVFHLSVYDFYNVMANHHELAQGFIKNIERDRKPIL